MLTVFCLNLGTIQAQELPTGTREGVGTSNERVCYGFQDFKILLKIDQGFKDCKKQQELLKAQNTLLKEVVDTYKKVNTIQQDHISLLARRNDELFEAWKEENRKRHEAENIPQATNWLAWGIAGVSLASLAGVLSYAALKR